MPHAKIPVEMMNTSLKKQALALIGALLTAWSAQATTYHPNFLGTWSGPIDDIQAIYAALNSTRAEVGFFLYRYSAGGSEDFQTDMFDTEISNGLRSDFPTDPEPPAGGQLATLTYKRDQAFDGIKYLAVETAYTPTSSSPPIHQFSLWKWEEGIAIIQNDTIEVDNRGLYNDQGALSSISRVAVIPDASTTLSLMGFAITGMIVFRKKIH